MGIRRRRARPRDPRRWDRQYRRRQFLAAGLVDELSLHVVPVLFGTGTRMFEDLGGAHITLEPVATIQTPRATHLRLRIAR
jgi:riboflavin biosynthesis pyrimidine reductase